MSPRKWQGADPLTRLAQAARARADMLKEWGVAQSGSTTVNKISGSGTTAWITTPNRDTWRQQYMGSWYSTSEARASAAYSRFCYVGGPSAGERGKLFLTPGQLPPATRSETDFGCYRYRGIENGVYVYEWVPMPEPTEREFYAEEIVGWRSWKLVVDEDATIAAATGIPVYQLAAISAETVWPAYQPLQAICDRALAMWSGVVEYKEDSHVVPEWNCECGVHAYKEKSSVVQPIEPLFPVYGQVSLWGSKIVVAETGYRAEFAYPRHLWLREWTHPSVDARVSIAAQLSETYGVPCECV